MRSFAPGFVASKNSRLGESVAFEALPALSVGGAAARCGKHAHLIHGPVDGGFTVMSTPCALVALLVSITSTCGSFMLMA